MTPRTVSFPSTPGGPADITLTEALPASYTLWRVNPDGTAIALADGTRGEMESAKTSCALGALPVEYVVLPMGGCPSDEVTV